MADNDIQGHMAILTQILLSDDWREIWLSLNVPIWGFANLSLTADASDAAVWHACQREEVILITGNRNEESDDSLQATMRAHNTPTSYPVMTISDPNAVVFERRYAHRVVESLLQYLLDIEKYRGAGRLWLP
jgi:hypothetical protein